MKIAVVLLAATAGLVSVEAARADLFDAINGYAVSPRWYNDYPGTTQTITNGGLPSLHVVESNFAPGTGFASRQVAFLAVNGAPFQFDPAQGFQFDVDVTINSNANTTEAGIIIGTAPSFPSSSSANTGDFHIRVPDGEIAAFGGTNPFFSNNAAPWNSQPWPVITTGQTYHMTVIYNTSVAGSSMNFGVNGVFTGNLASSQINPGTYVGVFAQGPNSSLAPGYVKDVTFANAHIMVPAPASFALLGLGGLVATRRRR